MPRKRHFVVDNNFAQRSEMRELLSASPHNVAVLTETVMIEWHKERAAESARQCFEVICEFPRQMVILKHTAKIIHINGSPNGLKNRLIDQKQTRDLALYCLRNIKAPLDYELASAFAALQKQAQFQTVELASEGEKMYRSFDRLRQTLSNAEVCELRLMTKRKAPLSGPLQRKTACWAFAHAAAMFKGIRIKEPRGFKHFVNTLPFRYSAMMLGLFLAKQERPGPLPTNASRLLNDMMDLKIAAQATYFDGFKTMDRELETAFDYACSFLRAFGAYMRCGKT